MKAFWLEICGFVLRWLGILGRREFFSTVEDLRFELHRLRQLHEHRPVFVIVTSSDGLLLSESVVLNPGYTARIRFVPQIPIPAGAHISLVGEALITDVTVGNNAQLLSHPSDMPFCIVRDACDVGNSINVGVRSTLGSRPSSIQRPS